MYTELFDGNLLDYEGRYGALRTVLKQSGVVLVAGYSGANFIFDEILGAGTDRGLDQGAREREEADGLARVINGRPCGSIAR